MKFKGGRVPYGFLAIDGEMVFDTGTRGQVLVWMIQWKDTGVSYRDLAELANSTRWPGPECPTWNHASVARVIKNGRKYSSLIPLKYILNK